MATKRTQTEILNLLANNATRDISAQDLRDAIVSARANQGSGWEFYSDSIRTTQPTAQAISASTRTKILCDGLGAFTSTDQNADLGATPAWSGDSLQVELNSAYIVRLSFKIQTGSAGSNNYFETDLDIGSGGLGTGPVVWKQLDPLIKGSGIEHSVAYAIPLFAKDPFPANGGSFFLTSNVDVDLWDVRVLIARIHKADN
jgi:hypothetical protein